MVDSLLIYIVQVLGRIDIDTFILDEACSSEISHLPDIFDRFDQLFLTPIGKIGKFVNKRSNKIK